ncbi:MAG: SAM-dependent methyltransferase [Dehalococcoidia bacterium]|nr:SAM-dependent methyltransferase [Dehalococcoidia bacterium]
MAKPFTPPGSFGKRPRTSGPKRAFPPTRGGKTPRPAGESAGGRGFAQPGTSPGEGRVGGEAAQGGGWNRAARWYDGLVGEQGSEFQREVVIPGTLRLLGIRQGERVLDLACGQGVLSRALHERGAQVTGVDLSTQLVEIARRRSPKGIRFLVADAVRLVGLDDGRFDAVTCMLALQNMESPEVALHEASRVLRPDGRLVLALMHPAFRIPRQSRWGWDEERKLLYRGVDRYLTPLKAPIDMRPFRAPGQITWTYHRPLQDYVKALADAGMLVDALEEWPSHKASQPGPMAAAENRARQEFPLFLAMRAVKSTRSPHP